MIVNSTLADIPELFRLYDLARKYQQEKSTRHWKGFERSLIEEEITQQRQWKIVEEGRIACIFMIAYQDPFIWGDKDRDPAVYIHRIVTNPDFRGRQYMMKIIDWAKAHAGEKGKKFLRMDTWGDNQKLTDYYTRCGFNFLGVITPQSTEQLPKHYSCISLSLLEIPL